MVGRKTSNQTKKYSFCIQQVNLTYIKSKTKNHVNFFLLKFDKIILKTHVTVTFQNFLTNNYKSREPSLTFLQLLKTLKQ